MAAESAAQSVSGGTMLRQAREALGLHIAALAVSLKVPVKKLEALEADRYDLLPDVVFVRALASSVCRSLKIDPVPVLEKLPHTRAPHLNTHDAGVNVPFRSSAGYTAGFIREQLSRPLVWVVAGLLAGVLALIFVPMASEPALEAAHKSPAAEATSAPAPAAPAVSDSVETVQSQVASGSSASAAGSTELVPGSGAVTGIIVFRARGQSWVEVVDAGGVVQLRRNLVAGEVVGVTGALPLSVVVGKADTTAVEVRGQAFDLLPLARDNVARFEVRQ